MKAIILNSGMGSRLGDLTKNNPKSMVHLNENETIFSKRGFVEILFDFCKNFLKIYFYFYFYSKSLKII